jgi:hypothetical protein
LPFNGIARLGLLALAIVTLAACNGTQVGGEAGPTTTASGSQGSGSDVLKALDPCTLLTSQELQQFGVDPSTRKPANGSGETGCGFIKYPIGIVLGKANDTVQGFLDRSDTFVKIAKRDVNGRSGVLTQISTENTDCSQVLAVGTGVVRIGLTGDKSGDPCGDVLKIAQVVEPKLPK